MNPIDAHFQRLRADGKKAFIPFLTAGDPDLETTLALVRESARRGATLIEIGIPYSDPIADGSVIQASYTRALDKGFKIDGTLAAVRSLAETPEWRKTGVPLVSMVSFSLVHHRGPARFVSEAREAGFSGAIVPDLPIDEADELARIAAEQDFKLIHLVTPTTPRERALRIARASTGFLYCVSVVGITGVRQQLPPQLLDQLRWLRTQTDLPLCVGFGISTAEHVHTLRDHADGIIVGSALVGKLAEAGRRPVGEVIREIGDQVETLARALAD
jgi:tryptophan synthase alpha chain